MAGRQGEKKWDQLWDRELLEGVSTSKKEGERKIQTEEKKARGDDLVEKAWK